MCPLVAGSSDDPVAKARDKLMLQLVVMLECILVSTL